MGQTGLMLQLVALFTAIGAAILYGLSFKDKSETYLKFGNYAFLISAASIVAASVILCIALAVSDFSIKYVAQYTDLSLPMSYKLTAFWAGQAGSLLLWALLLVVFTAIEIFRLKDKDTGYRSGVYLVGAVSSAFFIMLVAFVQNPFEAMSFIPRDGSGMNPMLQNPGMIIHPPTLYVGYVGFNIIIAHAFSTLINNDFSTAWIKLTRTWSLVIWVFLTVGIVIGGWWAYVELGWGGYWAWDPVENASLLPWFTATAFIHSAFIYERKNKMKGWTFALILATFELTILGTFITRSGVIESVHSFGKNVIGSFFLWFILITAVVYLTAMYKNRKVLEDKDEFSYLSKEGIFFIANWIFVGVTFVTVFGTFLPWFSEMLTDQKTTVGISYFNTVTMPFFMAMLVASGIAPMIPYGGQKPGDFLRKIAPSAIFAAVAVVIAWVLGYNKFAPIMLTAFIAFTFATIITRCFTMIKSAGIKSLVGANRFFAAMLVHLGVAVMAFGITMSAFYNKHVDEIVPQDSIMGLDNYVFEVGKIHTEKGANYISHYIPIKIYKDDTFISTAHPEMREYHGEENIFAEVSYYSMFHGDLYFILSGFDLGANQVRVQAIFQPFIAWIWAGCAMMVIGGLYGIFNFRRQQD